MVCHTTALPKVYQLRMVLKDVGPIIWRRILVTDATSIADLHVIRVVCGRVLGTTLRPIDQYL